MADILAFPADQADAAATDVAYDQFLLEEGLELLGDFRAIDDRAVRDSLRTLVKAMAVASRRIVATGEAGQA